MTDATRFAVVATVLSSGLAGWAAGGLPGAAGAMALAVALVALPWRGQSVPSWVLHYVRRNRPITLVDPVTVANDRSGGGVRCQDDVAAVAVHVLGKPHAVTRLIGSTASETDNRLDVNSLLPAMNQSLGLVVESLSVITVGSRRGTVGDYPKVYDTLIGTSPYAGQRETWLVIRVPLVSNGEALRWRPTAGTAALAAAQRITALLREQGIRARVASAAEVVGLERRVGRAALEPRNRRWHTARGDGGWLTSYAYAPADIRTEVLEQAWTLRADAIVQNLTLFPDGRACATVTVRTPQPPTAAPGVNLHTLPGEQTAALAAHQCGPRPTVRGVRRGALPSGVTMPIGPSGVLIGKTATGERLLVPLSDQGEATRVHVAADDAIAKRIVARTAGSGERLTVHTSDHRRWNSIRMPHVVLTHTPRPASGTTVSVVDGSVAPAPRPATVISVGPPESAGRVPADVLIAQIGPARVMVSVGGRNHEVQIDLFRAENRYVAPESSTDFPWDLEMAE